MPRRCVGLRSPENGCASTRCSRIDPPLSQPHAPRAHTATIRPASAPSRALLCRPAAAQAAYPTCEHLPLPPSRTYRCGGARRRGAEAARRRGVEAARRRGAEQVASRWRRQRRVSCVEFVLKRLWTIHWNMFAARLPAYQPNMCAGSGACDPNVRVVERSEVSQRGISPLENTPNPNQAPTREGDAVRLWVRS